MFVQFLKYINPLSNQVDCQSSFSCHLWKGTRIGYVFQVRIFLRNLNETTTAIKPWSFSPPWEFWSFITCSKIGLIWRSDGGTNLSTSLDCLPRWSFSGHKSHRSTRQMDANWCKWYRWSWKPMAFNYCLSLFVASNKHFECFPIFGHPGRFNVKIQASGYDKLTATMLVVLV